MSGKQLFPPLTALLGAAALLLLSSALLKGPATDNRIREQQQTMERLLPGSRTFTAEDYDGDDPAVLRVFRGEGGYVVETMAEGYVDTITVWTGVDDSGTVTGVTIRDMAETWGLGRLALRSLPFLEQFLHTAGDAAVGSNVDAITGATVTSRAVSRAVNSASAFVSGADISSGATEWGG